MKIVNILKDEIGQVIYNLQNGLLITLSNILNINHSGLPGLSWVQNMQFQIRKILLNN
jgi:hypothetical protein